MDKLTKEDTLLDTLLSERTGLECEGHGSLAFSHHERVEFKILRDVSKISDRIATMNFRRAET